MMAAACVFQHSRVWHLQRAPATFPEPSGASTLILSSLQSYHLIIGPVWGSWWLLYPLPGTHFHFPPHFLTSSYPLCSAQMLSSQINFL